MSFQAGSVTSTLGIDINPFARGMLQASGIMAVFPQTVTNFIANPIVGAIGVASQLGSAIGGAINESIQLAAANEQLRISYETMLGSADKANDLLAGIREFAEKTPFRLDEINNAGKQLIAFGFAGEDVIPTLRRLGDISAGLKIPLNDLAYLFGTTKVQGRLFAQDLNQFTSRGIPLIQELAKEFGVADSEVKKLVEQGKVGFPEVESAIRAMTDEGGKFNNLMDRLSDSAAGAWSNLQDTFDSIKLEIGNSILEGMDVKGLIKEMTDAASDLKPVIVDVTNALVDGLSKARPLLKEALKMLRDGAIWTGLADANNMNKNPYQQGTKEAGLGVLSANSADVNQLATVFNSLNEAREKLLSGLNEANKSERAAGLGLRPQTYTDSQKAVEDYLTAADGLGEAQKIIGDLTAASAKGEPIDEAAFKRAIELTQLLVTQFENARETLQRVNVDMSVLKGIERTPNVDAMAQRIDQVIREAKDAARPGLGVLGQLDDRRKMSDEHTAVERKRQERLAGEGDFYQFMERMQSEAERAAFDEAMDFLSDPSDRMRQRRQTGEDPRRPGRSRRNDRDILSIVDATVGGDLAGDVMRDLSKSQAGMMSKHFSAFDYGIEKLAGRLNAGGDEIGRAIERFMRSVEMAPTRGGGVRDVRVEVTQKINTDELAKALALKVTPHLNQLTRAQLDALVKRTAMQMYAQSVKEGL